MKKEPLIGLIIGAMKCGTSSLFHYLAEHPQVCPAKDKEPHFFSYQERLSLGLDYYRKLWKIGPQHRVVLEASTTYAMAPKYGDVAARIAGYQNQFTFKIIYLIRDPIKRIESHMRHLLAGGHVHDSNLIEEYVSYSEYAKQLEPYRTHFGRENIHILLLEDLKNNPEVELKKICSFLEIDPDYSFQKSGVVMNSQQTLNLNPQVRQLYEIPMVKALAHHVPPTVRQRFYGLFKRTKTYSPTISPLDKETIIQRLTPDLSRLQEEYAVPFEGKWSL